MNQQLWTNVAFFVLYAWSFLWKGIALWNAAKNKQRNWFIVMLILNTAGILELVYLFRFAKKRVTVQELKDGFKDFFSAKIKSK